MQTPPALIEAFQKIDGATVPSLEALRFRIQEISNLYNCPFISLSTGPSRVTQIYCCRHRKTIYQCTATVKFTFDSNTCICHLESLDPKHTHHIGQVVTHRIRNSLTNQQRDKIRNATKQGISAAKIRLDNKLTCSKDVLYGARRFELKEIRNKEIENLLFEMSNSNNWSNQILLDEDNRFSGAYVFHDPILNCNYANDLCVVDDTSCTNYFGMPLLVMISEDQNAHNQVLSFAIMQSRIKNQFIDYFQHVKDRIGEIRLFICDRNITQISALNEVWPNCLIIYCAIHIGRNIKDKVGLEMYHLYEKMRSLEITEDEFIRACEKHIKDNSQKKSARFLNKLLREKDHWLPSSISRYIHCSNDTSNRVEGFFGSLKTLMEHKLQPLSNLIRAVYIRGDKLLINSMNEKKISVPEYLMLPNEAEKVGTFALAIILSEDNDLHEQGVLSKEYNAECCKNHMIFGLPCRHLILQRMMEKRNPLLTLEDIPNRWIYSENFGILKKEPNVVEKTRVQKRLDGDWSFSSCIDRFERYFTVAKRSKEVRRVLDETLNTLGSLEHQCGLDNEILPPKNLLIPGAPECHPRRNVEKPGARSKKRKYRCSICYSEDHTAPRCPHAILNA